MVKPNRTGKVRMMEDGHEMWVPKDMIVYTRIEDEIKPVVCLTGYSIHEAWGLVGVPIEEQIKIMDARRLDAKEHMSEIKIEEETFIEKPKLEDFPTLKKSSKKTTSDWLFDN